MAVTPNICIDVEWRLRGDLVHAKIDMVKGLILQSRIIAQPKGQFLWRWVRSNRNWPFCPLFHTNELETSALHHLLLVEKSVNSELLLVKVDVRVVKVVS